MDWHAAEIASIVGHLRSDALRGLGPGEVQARLVHYGPNELAAEQRISPVLVFLRQFKNTLMAILIAATGLSALLGQVIDAAIIFAIILFCAILGFVQEYRADRALDALRRMLAPMVTVLRAGALQRVPSRELVPGDVIVLEAGDRIPADARLIEVYSLKCDEASLTGESFPVDKDAAPLAPESPLAERSNCVFAGTTVSYGRAKAIVTATGMHTEFGSIAGQAADVLTEGSPLERRTAEIGRWLGAVALAICGLAIASSVLRSWSAGPIDVHLVMSMVLFGVALAVAAVPEALPAIVTGALAIGMREMARRNAIVRRMPAVETLGCTTVICTDKTGTLTKGEMTARRIYAGGRSLAVSGSGYAPSGHIDPAPSPQDTALRLLLLGGVLCNDAALGEERGRWHVTGDPTEGALLALARKAGIDVERIRRTAARTGEVPFSSERKRMSTIHELPDTGRVAFVKGAPEVVIGRCTAVQYAHERRCFDDSACAQVRAAAEGMAADALRVLAIAYREVPEDGPFDEEQIESGLTLLGLVGMMDPPREEAVRAVEVCRRVRIRPVMITGDHQLTAVAVARELDIYRDGDIALTGEQLGGMDDSAFECIVDRVSVYARVSPLDKLRIVQAWKRRGEIVAMTGDGVNDAPALRHADIGIAMGISGTDVAKQAADMVLGDDNFATIVHAIELGRWVYDNIKKYLTYLLRANLTEVIVLGGVVIVAGPEFLPLLPAAILYINLATDGLPALALGAAPPDPDIMRRRPRDPRESVFSAEVRTLVLLGVVIECPIFLWIYFSNSADIEATRTKIFALFVCVELIIALGFRSLRFDIVRAPPHGWLLAAVIWELLLFAALIQVAAVRRAFGISMPSAADMLMVLGIAVGVLAAIELTKLALRRRDREAAPASPTPA